MDGHGEPKRLLRLISHYKGAVELVFMLAPLALVAYVQHYQTPSLVFRHHLFHEAATGISLVLSLFAAWVAFRCYRASGEPTLRYIALAFLGFALVYAPHGLLTRLGEHHPWLFLLYGAASRVVVGAFLLEALLRHGEAPHPVAGRTCVQGWLCWVAAILVVDGVVAVVAGLPVAGEPRLRLSLEALALFLCLAGIATIRLRRLRSGAIGAIQLALAAFAASSAAFMLTAAWTHQWWLAHALFAAGFLVLSHALVRVYLTTRSFATLGSEAEMVSCMEAAETAAVASRSAEMQIRRLFEGSPMGILVSEPSGRILFCNQRHADILGISAVEALGRNARDFHLEPERRDRAVAEALATGRPVSAEIPRLSGKDGLRWYRVTWAHQIFAGRHALVAWTLDVTDRHAADEAAAQARQAAPIPQPGEAMA